MPLAQVTESQCSRPFAVLLLVLFTVTCNMTELQQGEKRLPKHNCSMPKAVFAFPNLCRFLNTKRQMIIVVMDN